MKLHPTDRVSLIFGLLFLGIAGFWLALRMASRNADAVAWSVVGGLLLVGALGIAGIIVSSRRRHTDDHRP